MTTEQLGVVTIGQTPRSDLVPELVEILGPKVEVKEAGALDGLAMDEINRMAPGTEDYVLVTRLADGSSVKVAEKYVFPRLEEKIHGLFAQGISVVVLLCTGEFELSGFGGKGLLVRPQPILYNVTSAVGGGLKLGVVSPASDQLSQSRKRWQDVGRELVTVAASPYGDEGELEQAAAQLQAAEVQLVVLDCMGYTLAMQERVRQLTGAPVILARGIVARVLKELMG